MEQRAEFGVQQMRESIDISEEVGCNPDHVAYADREGEPIGRLFGVAFILRDERHHVIGGVQGKDPPEGHLDSEYEPDRHQRVVAPVNFVEKVPSQTLLGHVATLQLERR